MSKPLVGDAYQCSHCKMQIEIKTPCHCETGEPTFTCCGQPMEKLKPATVNVEHG
ncbi:hypothetical protein [Botrimarina mediterranea]|uniref:Desulfoferrodoxin N-terminal domain-containing protein n=1 Tax=Botrimarina mediterranea TaxID=2528022 RepID=A0A518K4K4_9BACT|nr:hypothetical protein [Botrimarina mediterranea]QDV72729.1 hypothetical protein Spa11_09110 [Botrimarina mediterranea]QDV77302.1 hypothetical protein K2D_08930 [Planctomycetes bacterium K2D]